MTGPDEERRTLVGLAGRRRRPGRLRRVVDAPRRRRPRTSAADGTLTIMVTNDDGVAAPGIDAVVQGLRALPHTKVTVVAPAHQPERHRWQDHHRDR